LGLSGWLIGVGGLGFLTASAFLTLGVTVGAEWAALVIGIGLMLLAAGLFLVGQRAQV